MLVITTLSSGEIIVRIAKTFHEVNIRFAKASAAFGRLRGNVWERSGIRLDTKRKLCIAVVLLTLYMHVKTCTVYQRHAKRLNHFHTCCLRNFLKIYWRKDPRYRSPEKGRNADYSYSSETNTVEMSRPCYQNTRWTFGEETPLWRPTSSKTFQRWSEEETKTPLKPFSRTSIPAEPWEQIAKYRAKWRNWLERTLVTMK